MSDLTGSCTLRVKPELLQLQAEQVYGKISELKSIFSQITDKINATANYWQGEASESYRADYKSNREDVDTMLVRFQNHVEDLNRIAAVYTQVENNLKDQFSSSLPADVIK